MNHRASKIRNLRTVKGLRGDELVIDLGMSFSGTLTSWMKKTPDSPYFRSFDILDNRYLIMPRTKTLDYYDENGCLKEEISGKWYFDVEQTLEDGSIRTIYTGKILFIDDITNSNGIELFSPIIESIFNNQFNNIFS